MYPEVIYGLVTEKNYASEPALLRHFARRHVKNRTYPGIMKL